MTENREEQLRIQALGAALSRRDWHATEMAYNAIRNEFDRRPVSRSTASSDKPHDAGSLRKLAFDMTCDQQFRLASFVAQNVGYVLEPEPGFPDEPDNATSIDAPLDVLAEAEIALDLACLLLGNHHAASQYKSVSDALVKIRGALATPTPSDAMTDERPDADKRTDAEIKAFNLHTALRSLLEDYKELVHDTNSEPTFESENDADKKAERALYDNAPLADWEPSNV
jgi:hypothetical protein